MENDTRSGIFDFVIVGAGSAGCLLAERLSADSANRVALIEAGADNKAWSLRVPAALPLLVRSRRYNWAFETTPQVQLNQRRLYWPRGKVVGGSSSINAMCAVRGSANDYDRWAEYGGERWNWTGLEPLLKEVAAAEQPGTFAGFAPVACPRAQRGEKGVLHRILGLGAPVQAGECEAEQRITVRRDPAGGIERRCLLSGPGPAVLCLLRHRHVSRATASIMAVVRIGARLRLTRTCRRASGVPAFFAEETRT